MNAIRALCCIAIAGAVLQLGGCGSDPLGGDLGGDYSDGQPAAVVIGQANFSDIAPWAGNGAPNAQGFFAPTALVVDGSGMLWVADSGTHRVLRFDTVPSLNGASATLVVGQPTLVEGTPGTAANRLDSPGAVTTDGTRLVVADSGSNRVLLWQGLPLADGAAANVVVGQNDMTSKLTGCTPANLNQPGAALIAGGRLILADTGNNRVLIWNTLPASYGVAADRVLGQADFAQCNINRGGAVAADTLFSPSGLWSDGQRLIVADTENHRILIWNTFPTADGQAADRVLGQDAMDTRTAGLDAHRLDYPTGVHYDGVRLFVADSKNNRVLVWNTLPGSNGTPADNVLGQADFTSKAITGGVSGLLEPTGIFSLGTRLLVADTLNNRVLIYVR